MITYTMNFTLIHIYIWTNKSVILSPNWAITDWEAFKKIPEFLGFGASSSLMLIFEWCAYEFLNFYSGWLGVNELAVNVITLQILMLMFINPLGLTYGVTNLVGNSLGKNRPITAKTYVHVSLAFGLFCNLVIIGLVCVFRDHVFSLFSSDEALIEIFGRTAIFFGLNAIFDLSAAI